MKIEKQDLISAATKIGLPRDSVDKLWDELNTNPSTNKLNLSMVLYYFGAFLILLALTWFLGETWDRFGGKGIFIISSVYLISLLLLGSFFWNKKDLKTPGGLLITLAVCLIPLAVYGFQKWFGWWITEQPGEYQNFFSWIRGGWFLMEIATLVGGLIALYIYRFPFLTMPIFFTLWFMSMDSVPLLFGEARYYTDIREKISIVFGLIILAIAYTIDLKGNRDFAFWPYFFGLLSFWGGLSLLESSSEAMRFIYLLINLGLMLLSVLLQRTVFLFFGVLGVMFYIISLFNSYFQDSLSFPIFLSVIGLLVLFLGIFYHKNHLRFEAWLRGFIPESLRKWLPKE